MKEIPYQEFSLRTHKKNWLINKPNVCQFELTFNCDFHCLYCYSDCYNNPRQIKDELSTEKVKVILDKVYNAGCLWLCFSGGDPLKRADFLEIYSYARQKGFIISIFTNGYSLSKKIADFLKDMPPFVIELTINATSKKTFEGISQLPDSYERVFRGIDMLIKCKIPTKIKMVLIKNNLKELSKVRDLARGLGLGFKYTTFINARLNQDNTPCSFRLSPQEVFNLNGKNRLDYVSKEENNCFHKRTENTRKQTINNRLFNCAAGCDSIIIDPYGRMFFCLGLREFSIDLLEQDIKEALLGLFPKIRQKKFSNDSPCCGCQIRGFCYSCPGGAFLEKGDMESPVEWFCELTHLVAGKNNLQIKEG